MWGIGSAPLTWNSGDQRFVPPLLHKETWSVHQSHPIVSAAIWRINISDPKQLPSGDSKYLIPCSSCHLAIQNNLELISLAAVFLWPFNSPTMNLQIAGVCLMSHMLYERHGKRYWELVEWRSITYTLHVTLIATAGEAKRGPPPKRGLFSSHIGWDAELGAHFWDPAWAEIWSYATVCIANLQNPQQQLQLLLSPLLKQGRNSRGPLEHLRSQYFVWRNNIYTWTNLTTWANISVIHCMCLFTYLLHLSSLQKSSESRSFTRRRLSPVEQRTFTDENSNSVTPS